jgi:hypothetical protein
MRLVAFFTGARAVRQMLASPTEPTSLQYIAPVRGPPLREMAYARHGKFDAQAQPAQPAPDCEFEQRIVWSGRLDEDLISRDLKRSCLRPQAVVLRPIG